MELSLPTPDGVLTISKALSAVEMEDEELSVTVSYLGAPRYLIAIKAPDYKMAEEEMKSAVDKVEKTIQKAKGTFQFKRTD